MTMTEITILSLIASLIIPVLVGLFAHHRATQRAQQQHLQSVWDDIRRIQRRAGLHPTTEDWREMDRLHREIAQAQAHPTSRDLEEEYFGRNPVCR